MKLTYKGRRSILVTCTAIANKILDDKEFHLQIENHKHFDNTSPKELTPAQISGLLKNHPKTVFVKTYRAPTGANAKTRSRNNFKVNVSRLDRSKSSIIRTLIHEYVHCVDRSHSAYKFTHVDNSNRDGEEDNTAPWAIGYLAEEFSKKYL